MKKVNIIDTLGFCDSQLSASQVLDAIKSSVKVNCTSLDKVVIVCSGRIEGKHTAAILQFMDWLNYSSYRDKFVFVYNKCDGQTLGTKTANLADMCDLFGVDTFQDGVWVDRGSWSSIRMNLTTGFPPEASYDTIEDDLTALVRAVLCTGVTGPNDSKRRRIPVSKDSCTIL